MANLAALVRVAARETPQTLALVDRTGPAGGRRTMSWASLDADVDAAATGLAGLGLRPGDRVALVLDNGTTFVAAYFGALRAGLVAVPVNTSSTAPELARVLGDAQASAVIAGHRVEHVVEEAVAGTHRVVVTEGASYDALLAAGRDARAHGRRTEPATGGDDLAVLLFTSGVSGAPRGAMLSHRALRANLDQCAAVDPPPMTEGDVALVVLPLFHAYALNAVLGLAARTRATCVLLDHFDPAGSLSVMEQEGVTNVACTPGMYAAWAEQPGLPAAFARVRTMVSGAAPLPPAVLDRMHARTGRWVHDGYGLTETAPVCTTTLRSSRVSPGSVGRPLDGVDLRLVDDQGQDVEDGDPGEIVVRGPNLFCGYWPDGSGGPDEDGWFATGDIAYADENGDLHLVDRRKELILVNGFNVYPREVEEALTAHPDVAEAAVVGVPHPTSGEAVKAFVVARVGAALAPVDVTEHCSTRLAGFKCPSVVEVVPELPHTATGKVAKHRLRAQRP